MQLQVTVDEDSGVVPWRQVYDQIVRLVRAGTLAPGTQLPPIRRLARDLALAPGTVARVYRELEAGGWVRTARAKGTVIAETADQPDRTVLLHTAVSQFVEAVQELGFAPEEITRAVHEAVIARVASAGDK